MCTTRNWTLDGSQITWFQTSEELTTPPNGLTDGLYYLCNDHLLPTIYTLWPKIKVLYITRCVFFRRILIWWSQVGIFANWAAKYKIHMETEWWCLFGDQSDHIWQYQEMWECYTCSGPVFWCEFNGNVCLVIRVTIYGNTGKCGSVIHVLDRFFDVNSMAMSVSWSEWPYMAIPGNVGVLYMF